MRGGTRKRGSTWTAYWWSKDDDGKWHQHSKGGFKRERDARSHLNKLLERLEDGSWRPDSPMTVKQLFDGFYLPARRSEGLRPATMAQYEMVVTTWIEPRLGDVEVRRLAPGIVQEWVTALQTLGGKREKPLSPRSVQLAVTVLKAATAWATANGYLNRDPIASFKRPRGGTTREMTWWTPEQAAKFLDHVRGDRLEALWAFALARGPRRGEVVGLRWPNVDLTAGKVHIVETRIIVGGRVVTSTPKTEAGRRTNKLGPELVALFKAQRRRQTEERLRAGEAWEGTDYVFMDELGRPYSPEWVADRFYALAKKAKVPVIRFHDLRHTAASLALAGGEDPSRVAAMLGHSSSAVTLAIYRHLMPGENETPGEYLDRLLLRRDEQEG